MLDKKKLTVTLIYGIPVVLFLGFLIVLSILIKR